MSERELIQHVRAGDYDRFLAIQLAPAQARLALYILTAFNLELARIAEAVNEPMLGAIRLAWWREALEEIMAGRNPRQHPLVAWLAELHREQAALFPLLLQMVDAREAEFAPELLASDVQWCAYLAGTAGALHRAWALVLKPGMPPEALAQVEKHAIAYAMTGLVRAIAFHTSRGWKRFSAERIAEFNLVGLHPSVVLTPFVERLLKEADESVEPSAPPPFWRGILPLKALSALAAQHRKTLRANSCDPYRNYSLKLWSVWRLLQMKILLY